MERTEEDFQKQTNDYAQIAIANLREMVEALEHSDECDGEIECEDCEGTGNAGNITTAQECGMCKGSGMVPCSAGKDSDDPESWADDAVLLQYAQVFYFE